MSEFGDRIAAQRHVVQLINESGKFQEELFGLSSKAIERWILVNRLDAGAILPSLVRRAADELLFLANRSQEQVTEEYRAAFSAFSATASRIRTELG